jgi:SAM-dependent methyltransferase
VRSRIYQPEIMDLETPDQATVDEIYRYLAAVNRFLGGVRATISRFESFSRTWRAGERIEVLEVACGAADIARAIVAWGRSRRFDVRVTATDLLPSALDYARRLAAPDERLRLVAADVMHPPFEDGAFDYVTCALFFHHLTDGQIVDALASFDRLATRGIVVNDLVRSRRAYVWTWLFTRPFHPILHHDGPLSIRRALRPAEIQRLAFDAGLPWLNVRKHFGHRMTLAGEKRSAVPPDEKFRISSVPSGTRGE